MTTQQYNDKGFSLIELLIMIVILGLLATVVVFSVAGVTDGAAASGCGADVRTLATATEAFFAQKQVSTITATGTSDDRYELTLVDEQFLRSPSEYHDLNADGNLVQVSGSPCTVS